MCPGAGTALKSIQSEGIVLGQRLTWSGEGGRCRRTASRGKREQADEVLEGAVAAAQEKETADLEALEAARRNLMMPILSPWKSDWGITG